MCFRLRFLKSLLRLLFNDTATTEIYTLSLHDALPILHVQFRSRSPGSPLDASQKCFHRLQDRKSTRLNSSHITISYAVFCLTKKTTRSGAPDTSTARPRVSLVVTLSPG